MASAAERVDAAQSETLIRRSTKFDAFELHGYAG
jgi:hypothetical protein